jgi:hypothetical protein
MKANTISIAIMIGLMLFTVAGADDALFPKRGYISGDTVFTGSGDWYLNPVIDKPFVEEQPPVIEKTADYEIDWSEPVRLTYFEGDDWRPRVSIWRDYIHMIWRHYGHGVNDIYYMRSSDRGESWSDTINLSHRTGSQAVERPSIESNSQHVLAFWHTTDDILYHSRSSNRGIDWESLGRYAWNTSNPLLLSLDNNSVLLCFYDLNESGRWIDRTTDWGNSWQGAQHLSDMGLGGRMPNMTDNANYVHIGYNQRWNTLSTEIHYHHSSDYGQTWITDRLLTENDGCPSQWASTSVHDSIVHIAWDDMKYGGNDIITIRSTDNGLTWGDEYRISYSGVGRDSWIVAGDAGTFVVWNDARHSDSINSEVYLRASYDDGETWQPEERVTFALGASSEPFVALEGNGLFLFWIDTRDSLGYYEIYFKKGQINYTGVNDDPPNVPSGLSLSVNPNPFNSSTTINYSIDSKSNSQSSKIKLTIYNLTGQEVATLVDRQHAPGTYTVTWEASGHASGIYFARLTTGNKSATEKMVLVK